MPLSSPRRVLVVEDDPSISRLPEKAIDKATATIVDERIDARMDDMIDELISFSARLRVPHKAPRVQKATGSLVPNMA